jgi:HSP20 family molecular chaperone IbpA
MTNSTSNVDSDGFQQVAAKKRTGPRGQRVQRRNENNERGERPERNERSERPERKDDESRMTYRDLKYQLGLLQKRMHSPKVDLLEIEDSFVVKMEVPGLLFNELRITIQDNQFLLVSGNKFEEYAFEEDSTHRAVYKECKYGNFMRRVKLPALVKNKKVSLSDGVLTIVCEKRNNTHTHLEASLDDIQEEAEAEAAEQAVPPNTPNESESKPVSSNSKSWADLMKEPMGSWADEI